MSWDIESVSQKSTEIELGCLCTAGFVFNYDLAMENHIPDYLGRHKQLSQKIEELLALPPPIPAEKHLLREQILELELRRLETVTHLTDEQMMQLAVDLTLAKVPQNVFSYPMHLRETTMPMVVGYIKEYPRSPGRPPQPSEVLTHELEEKLAAWRAADKRS